MLNSSDPKLEDLLGYSRNTVATTDQCPLLTGALKTTGMDPVHKACSP